MEEIRDSENEGDAFDLGLNEDPQEEEDTVPQAPRVPEGDTPIMVEMNDLKNTIHQDEWEESSDGHFQPCTEMSGIHYFVDSLTFKPTIFGPEISEEWKEYLIDMHAKRPVVVEEVVSDEEEEKVNVQDIIMGIQETMTILATEEQTTALADAHSAEIMGAISKLSKNVSKGFQQIASCLKDIKTHQKEQAASIESAIKSGANPEKVAFRASVDKSASRKIRTAGQLAQSSRGKVVERGNLDSDQSALLADFKKKRSKKQDKE